MEALIEKEARTTNSSNIQFLNQAEEKSEIYLFKSVEDAELAKSDLAKCRNKEKIQIALVNNHYNADFVNQVEKLIEEYEKVIFVYDEGNFELDEISNFGLKTNGIVYQALSKVISNYTQVIQNPMSAIYHCINNTELSDIFGKELLAFEKMQIFGQHDESEMQYLIYKNLIIKLWTKKSSHYQIGYFKVLTNYTFKITKIKTYWNNEISDKQDLEIEITDFEGRTYTANLNGKDRYKLDAFRNVLRPIGNFVDDFKPLEFKQIFNQLYLEISPEEYDIIRNPGFIEDRNIYLTANEVINLEN